MVYSTLFTTQKYGKCNYKVLYNLSVGELYDMTGDLSKHGYHIKVVIPTTGQARTLYIAVLFFYYGMFYFYKSKHIIV